MSGPPHPHHLVAIERVPSGSQWLGPREQTVEAGLSVARRRREWRAGRWAAKRVSADALGRGLDEAARLQVIAAEDGAPELWIDGDRCPRHVSISHRAGWAGAAFSAGDRPIGFDLEVIEERSVRFVNDFFTASEVHRYEALPSTHRDLYAVTVWSAKESLLKCLRTGLRRDTRTVEIDLLLGTHPEAEVWQALGGMDLSTGQRFRGWWRRRDPLLLTLLEPEGAAEDSAPGRRPAVSGPTT